MPASKAEDGAGRAPQASGDRKSPATGHRRAGRNLLLDRGFQLKYTGYLVGIALAVGVPLAGLMHHRSSVIVTMTNDAIQASSQAHVISKASLEQALLLNRRLEMEALLRYQNDPAQLDAMKKASQLEVHRIEARTREVAAAEERLREQRARLVSEQNTLLAIVLGSLLALVAAIGVFGVVITHRVVGPIHRMRKLFAAVGEGNLAPVGKLRKNDELKEFYADFAALVEKLRERQRVEISRLDAAIERVGAAGAPPESVSDLKSARDSLVSIVDGKPTGG